jgi:hypothetical protein
MIPRRVFLGAAALRPLATDNAFAQAPMVTPVHVQDLPDVGLDGSAAVFYEPPGVLHSVPANASRVNPARFLAVVVAEKGAPITVTP